MGNQNLIEKTYWFDYFIETEISKCYKMVSCPHGKCIIINIMNFDGHALITRWRSRKNTFWKALLHCWYQLWSYFIPNVGWSSWDCCSRLQGIYLSSWSCLTRVMVLPFLEWMWRISIQACCQHINFQVSSSHAQAQGVEKKVIYTCLAGNTSMQLFCIAIIRTKTIRTKKKHFILRSTAVL